MAETNLPQLPYEFAWNFTQGATFKLTLELEIGGVPAVLSGAVFRAELRDATGAIVGNGETGAADEISVAIAGNSVTFRMSPEETLALADPLYEFAADVTIDGETYPLCVVQLARKPRVITGA